MMCNQRSVIICRRRSGRIGVVSFVSSSWWSSIALLLLVLVVLIIPRTIDGSAGDNDNSASKSSTTSSLRLGGYVPDYRIGMTELNQSFVHLDDVYIFSIEPKIINSYTVDIQNTACCINWKEHIPLLQKAIQYKKEQYQQQQQQQSSMNNKEIKVWLTIGGGGRSDTLLKMNRTAFVIEVIKLLKNPKTSFITGIDMDGEIRFSSQEEYIQYAKLIIYIAKQVHKYGPSGTLLSVALHAQQYLPKSVYNYIDVVHLMTYDMSNQIYHADVSLVESAIQNIIASGCPESKLRIGIPAYGRHQNSFHNVKTYNEIITDYMSTNPTIRLDSSTEFNKLNIWNQYEFESIMNIRIKLQSIVYKKYPSIRGIFLWEIGQDKFVTTNNNNDHHYYPQYRNGILLSSIASIINEINDKQEEEMMLQKPKQTIESNHGNGNGMKDEL